MGDRIISQVNRDLARRYREADGRPRYWLRPDRLDDTGEDLIWVRGWEYHDVFLHRTRTIEEAMRWILDRESHSL